MFREMPREKESSATNFVADNQEISAEEQLKEKINELSEEQIVNFVDNDLKSIDPDLANQEVLDLVFDKVFKLAEKDVEKYREANFDILLHLHNAVQPDSEKVPRDKHGDSITDKSFRSTIKLYEKYPLAGHTFFEMMGQEFTVSPKVFISEAVTSSKNRYLFNDFFHSLHYLYAFAPSHYQKEIASHLDFDNPKNFHDTGIFLELIARLHSTSSETEFSEENAHGLLEAMETAAREKRGSYLLNARADKLISMIKHGQHHSGVDLNDQISVPNPAIDKGDILDFSYLSSKPICELIKKDFGIDIKLLSATEQLYFLDFLKRKRLEEIEPVKNFTKTFGKEGAKTFLSLEFGKELGDDIVMLGKTLPEKDARAIFEKYNEIVSNLSQIDEMVPDGLEKTKLVEEAKENLLRRARKLIEDFSEKQKQAIKSGKSLDSKEITEKLSRISAYNQSYISVFKATQNNNPWLTFEDFKDFEFGEEFVFDLEGDELIRMIEIYKENYKSTPRFQEKLLTSFGEIISKLSQPIQILRHKGRIIGFYLYTPREDGGLDFRSFNVDPNYSGAGLGKVMMNQELQDRALNNVIRATCTAELPISSEYIESGFVGIGYGSSEEINYLEIARNDRKKIFPSKGWYDREDFDPTVKKKVGNNDSDNDWFYVVAEKDVNKLPFNLAGKEENGYVYVLTRYLRPEKGYPKYVLVFEKTVKSELENYRTT